MAKMTATILYLRQAADHTTCAADRLGFQDGWHMVHALEHIRLAKKQLDLCERQIKRAQVAP